MFIQGHALTFGRPPRLIHVKYALRGLLRDRTFTLVALLSIALGVGANSAIFSLLDQALFRNLPIQHPERLVLLDWRGPFLGRGWGSGNLMSYPFYRDLAAENQVFDGVMVLVPVNLSVVSGDGKVIDLQGIVWQASDG